MESREPVVAYGRQRFTESEYLRMEEESPVKNEYYRGEIFAMAGATLAHNRVVVNFLLALSLRLPESCQAFNSDTKVYIEQNTLFTYPDVLVVCGDIETRNNDGINVCNPAVIVEVLSAATREYDKKEKFAWYKALPSLKHYVLAEPGMVQIEVWSAGENGAWSREIVEAGGAEVILSGVKVSIPVAEVYKRTGLV